VFPAAQFRQNTILLHLPVEPLEQTIKAFFFTSCNFSQVASLPFLNTVAGLFFGNIIGGAVLPGEELYPQTKSKLECSVKEMKHTLIL
jgi:hypothetical protein